VDEEEGLSGALAMMINGGPNEGGRGRVHGRLCLTVPVHTRTLRL